MSQASTAARYLYAWHTGTHLVEPELGVGKNSKYADIKPPSTFQRSVAGRLVYNDDKLPIANMKINFYSKDFFNFKHFAGYARSDANGNFSFHYNWQPGILTHSQRVVMELVQEYLPFAKQGLPSVKREASLQQIERRLPVKTHHHAIGNIPASYHDISKDLTVVAHPIPSHSQTPQYFWKLIWSALAEMPKRLFIAIFGRWLSITQVQRIYDSFGVVHAKRQLKAENLIDELLNHVSAVEGQTINNQIIWTANWDGLELDQHDSLPNVRVKATKDATGYLKLDSIAVKFRSDAKEQIVRPGDDKFDWALYLARSTFALKGEGELHLGEGHILPGIPAEEFFKYVTPQNPLYSVLQPHLGQIDFIDWLGSKGVIFGSGSVLDMSALSTNDVAQLVINAVKKKADWKSYKPRAPLAVNHYFAKGEQLHYNLLLGFLKNYIAKNHKAITKDWAAVHRWSTAMQDKLDTFPALTTNKTAPTIADLANLTKFCAWLVTKTTFLHWAAHSRQQLLTDIRQTSLSVKGKALDAKGCFQPYGNTTVDDANMQLFIARVLCNFNGDSIFKNPYGDVNKELLALLKKHVGDYEGYDDILKMFITTQI